MKLDLDHVLFLAAGGATYQQIASEYGVSRQYIYQEVKKSGAVDMRREAKAQLQSEVAIAKFRLSKILVYRWIRESGCNVCWLCLRHGKPPVHKAEDVYTRQQVCRECSTERKREWWRANRERENARKRAHYDPAKMRIYQQNWQLNKLSWLGNPPDTKRAEKGA